MLKKKLLGIVLIIVGFVFILNSFGGITGFAILNNVSKGLSSIFGAILVFGGIGLYLLVRERKSIDDLDYDVHALERMEERRIPPSAVKNAIKNGDHYRLKRAEDFGEAKGATDVYISHGSSKTGSRGVYGGIKEKSVIVLTGSKGEVKTTFVRNDAETRAFLRKYVNSN